MTQKNKDADSTNPNFYSSIDDEHVYDEIKQKEGYKDPGKSKLLSAFSKKIKVKNLLFFVSTTLQLNDEK